jgi:glycerol uptake facilitator-like aquaporin
MTVRWLYWFSLSPQFSSRFQCVRRNPWVQGLLREVLAELLGTFWLMFIGMCGNAQFIIAANGSWAGFLDQAWAWALGLTFAIYMAGGISGAHLNPAVTLAMATHRGFEW